MRAMHLEVMLSDYQGLNVVLFVKLIWVKCVSVCEVQVLACDSGVVIVDRLKKKTGNALAHW